MDSFLDCELLPLARSFDPDALAAIYDRYSNGIYYYALRMLGQADLAEECTAETFHRLLRALRHGGGPNDNMRAYLYRSAHNWITDLYRRTTPVSLDAETDIVDEEDNPGQTAEQNILQERVRAALRLLTPEQRQVIFLRYVEGWDLEEIAISMQKTHGAIKALQHRGIAALQKLLL